MEKLGFIDFMFIIEKLQFFPFGNQANILVRVGINACLSSSLQVFATSAGGM